MKIIGLYLTLIGVLVVISGCVQELPTVEEVDIEEVNEWVNLECEEDVDCSEGVCEDGSKYKKYSCANNECVVLQYVRNPCEPEAIENQYVIGDEVDVGGTIVLIKDISQKGELTLIKQDDVEVLIKGTGSFAKIGNHEITIREFELDLLPSDRSIVLDIEEIALGNNEYLLNYREGVELNGKTVILWDVDTDDLESISVKVKQGVNSDTERINKGKTEEISDLQVTNIRSNARTISYEKYAIIKVQ